MKFNVGAQPNPLARNRVEVGNVYPAQGNKPTAAWIVVEVREGRAVLLGIDSEGQVCSAQTYAVHAMEDRPVIGRCACVAEMQLDVEWTGEPRAFRGGL
jgi:hypothetical protein